jgi:mannitol-1-phosphate/altronate dehydrogenase
VQEVLRDNAFWGEDLHALPGFHQSVVEKLNMIISSGVKETLETVTTKKSFAA